MKPRDSGDRFILRQVTDGSGREHDLFVEPRDGKVVLSCPTAFWSITITPSQGDVLGPAIQDASAAARKQVSR